jgi:Meckel syndrome type 1 protein
VKSILKGHKPGDPAKPASTAAAARPGDKPAAGAAAKPGQAAKGEIKRPAILKDDEPTNVTAKHLVYNSESGHADYTGGAWLWQGETSIKADSITIDDDTGNLTASGSVNSRMRMEQTDDKEKDAAAAKATAAAAAAPRPAVASTSGTSGAAAGAAARAGGTAAAAPAAAPPAATAGAKTVPVVAKTAGQAPQTGGQPQPAGSAGGKTAATAPKKSSMTVATSKDMVYVDAERKATYTGEAHVVSDEGDLKGDKVEMFLDESGRGLERLEAYTNVTYIQKTTEGSTRRGMGDRLTYFADDGRYIMSGIPVNVLEKMPTAECRETTGRTLTFYRSTDSITFDGKEQSRTQSKSGAKCPEQFP